MNILCSVLVLFLFAICVSAQVSPISPEVTVLQSKWHFEVHDPSLEKDTLQDSKDRQGQENKLKDVAQDNENRVKQGEPTLPPPGLVPKPTNGTRDISADYIYEVTIKNTGREVIKTLNWEYVFLEPGTGREVGRRVFINQVSIKPGTSKHLVQRTVSSPTGTIDAKKAGKKLHDHYAEQVVIRRIEYADGSIWTADSK